MLKKNQINNYKKIFRKMWYELVNGEPFLLNVTKEPQRRAFQFSGLFDQIII